MIGLNNMKVVIDSSLLDIITIALQRDVEEGKTSRKAILEEIQKTTITLQEAFNMRDKLTQLIVNPNGN